MATDHTDVREFFTALGEHKCPQRAISSADIQGDKMSNTFVGFSCECGESHTLGLSFVKALQRPLFPYLRGQEDRIETARRLTESPEALLLEMRNSGGWAQPDPGVVLTAMAAAVEGPGGRMDKQLQEMIRGSKPN